MSGNICRCSAYPNIINAIQQVIDNRGIGRELASQGDADTGAKVDRDAAQIWSPPPSNIHHPAAQAPNPPASSQVGDAQ